MFCRRLLVAFGCDDDVRQVSAADLAYGPARGVSTKTSTALRNLPRDILCEDPSMATPKFVRPLPRCLSILVASACVSLGSTGAARPGFVTYTTNCSTFNLGTLPYFDFPALPLTEVSFQIQGSVFGMFTFYQTVSSAEFDGNMGVEGFDPTTGNVLLLVYSPTGTSTENFDPPASSADGTVNFDFGASYTDQATLDSFQRQGSYSVYPGGNISSPDGYESGFKTVSDATVTVTYFFPGTPEPPSAILLALGLMPVLVMGAYRASSRSVRSLAS